MAITIAMPIMVGVNVFFMMQELFNVFNIVYSGSTCFAACRFSVMCQIVVVCYLWTTEADNWYIFIAYLSCAWVVCNPANGFLFPDAIQFNR